MEISTRGPLPVLMSLAVRPSGIVIFTEEMTSDFFPSFFFDSSFFLLDSSFFLPPSIQEVTLPSGFSTTYNPLFCPVADAPSATRVSSLAPLAQISAS